MKTLEKVIKTELGLDLLPLVVSELEGTLLAMLECGKIGDNAKILVLEKYLSEYDRMFVIAHEMRHYWQILNSFEVVNNADRSDKDIYNSQIAEIDANAFAAYVLIKYYKVKPLFNGISDKVKKRIYDYLAKTFNLKI